MSIVRMFYLKFCPREKSVCEHTFDNLHSTLIINIFKRFEPKILCPKYGFCSNPKIIPDDFEEYKRTILRDKPPRKYVTPQNTTMPIKFVVFNDVHMDPNYTRVIFEAIIFID